MQTQPILNAPECPTTQGPIRERDNRSNRLWAEELADQLQQEINYLNGHHDRLSNRELQSIESYANAITRVSRENAERVIERV